MPPNALKAVIFDMDGVLTATVEYHYQSWKRATEEFGIPFSRQLNEKLLGLTRRRSLEVILGDRKLPEAQMQDLLQKKNDYFLQSVEQMSVTDLMPGVMDLLLELRASGIRLAVASSSRNTAPVLRRLGLDTSMEVICDGNMVRRSKPAPDVFILAAERLRLPRPACLVIEDSESGVAAARAAGMCVVGVGPALRASAPGSVQAQRVFPDLTHVNLKVLQAIHRAWLDSLRWREGSPLQPAA